VLSPVVLSGTMNGVVELAKSVSLELVSFVGGSIGT